MQKTETAYAGPNEGAPCLVCKFEPTSASLKIFDFLEFLKENTGENRYYKNEADLDAYFYMYRKGCAANSPSYQAYLDHYKKYIKAAEEIYDVPFSALACLMFKESQFDNTARIGIAQFTSAGTTTINESCKSLASDSIGFSNFFSARR